MGLGWGYTSQEAMLWDTFGHRYLEPCRLARNIVIVLLLMLVAMLLGRHSVLGAQLNGGNLGTDRDGFHTFHVRPDSELHPHSSWEDLTKGYTGFQKSSCSADQVIKANGLGLPLVHRNSRGSPFRAVTFKESLDSVADNFTILFQTSLERDSRRVRAIQAMINEASPKADSSFVAGPVASPPVESTVISGLDYGSGEYFTSVSFGSPPTDLLVTMDTGSDLTWVQCHPCASCFEQIGPIYNPAASGSYATVACYSTECMTLELNNCLGATCQYSQRYGDGSFSSGDFSTETITMNSTNGEPFDIHGFLFGCGHDNEGLFKASAGLLGLGRGHLSFPSQISRVLAPRFSYCLTDRFKMSNNNGEGDYGTALLTPAVSYIYFGEPSSSTMKYTDLLINPMAPTFYYARLTGISVANEPVHLPSSTLNLDMASGRGGVILDSGTAITRLCNGAFEAMRDAFRYKARHLKTIVVPNQHLFDTCYELTGGQKVPTVTLHFARDVNLELPMDNAMIPVDASGMIFCLAFGRAEGQGDLTIIGNVQQQGFLIEYDLENGKVGFTKEDCSYQ